MALSLMQAKVRLNKLLYSLSFDINRYIIPGLSRDDKIYNSNLVASSKDKSLYLLFLFQLYIQFF